MAAEYTAAYSALQLKEAGMVTANRDGTNCSLHLVK